MSTTIVTASITAENTFSTPVQLQGYFNLSLSGTWVATVTVQRSIDNVSFVDVDTFTENTEEYGFEPENMFYRVGVKTGQFTSGTVAVRLGREYEDRYFNV
jgi:hypothetical protein